MSRPRGAPRESWLRSEDPEKFAEAMMRCKHPGGFCAQDGFCHRDGKCFTYPKQTVADELWELRRRIERLEEMQGSK